MENLSLEGKMWNRMRYEERLEQVLRKVTQQPGMTTLMIARRIAVSKTYARDLLVELQARDAVHYTWQFMTNGLRVMVFYPNITPVGLGQEVEDDEGYAALVDDGDASYDDDEYHDTDDREIDDDVSDYLDKIANEDPRPEDFLPF